MSTPLGNEPEVRRDGNDPEVRTYRGRGLEELIPRIRQDLGPDAIILREREGLTGGFNGFFAQRCIEVDVQAAPAAGLANSASRVDFYDEDESAFPQESTSPAEGAYAEDSAYAGDNAGDNAVPEELNFSQRLTQARRERAAEQRPTPSPFESFTPDHRAEPGANAKAHRGIRFMQRPAPRQPGAAMSTHGDVAAMSTPGPVAAPPLPAPEPPQTASPAQLDTAAAGAVARELIGHGISETWAHELIVTAAAHMTPFAAQGDLREAVRSVLAATISTAPPLPNSGAAVAFVGAGGAGKSRCSAALAAAYARASTLRVNVLSLSEDQRTADVERLLAGRGVAVNGASGEAEAVARGRERGLVVVDTGAISPADTDQVARLGDELFALELDAIYLAVPAILSGSAARTLLDGLAPLGVSAIAITHADESDELGIAIELSYTSGLPIAYVHRGVSAEGALVPADPGRLSRGILP